MYKKLLIGLVVLGFSCIGEGLAQGKGLVLYLPFDEGKGDIVKDISGNGNDGTIYGARWVDGKFGKALSFDGIDDYVELKDRNLHMGGNDFTIAAWVKPASFPIAHGSICGSPYYGMAFEMSSTGALALVKVGTMTSPSSTGTISLDTLFTY